MHVCISGVIQMKTSFCGYYFLAQVLFRLHSSAACIQVCQEGRYNLFELSVIVSC